MTHPKLTAALEVKVGCCGFPVARQAYFATFPVVEIPQTFSQPPQVKTAARWRAEAPAGFEFSLKAWPLIAHEASRPTSRRVRRPAPPGSGGTGRR